MFGFVPIIFFLFLFLTAYNKQPSNLKCWRTAFLFSAVVWGTEAVLSLEFFSLFSVASFNSLLFLWAGLAGVEGYNFCKSKKKVIPFSNFNVSSLMRSEIFYLSGITAICALVGIVAFIAPPNTWDSMTYHMSRVAHWKQNHTLAHYPTHILRQNIYTPCAEMLILHFQILSGSDRWANLIQWFSMVGSVIGVSLIAKQLGADRRGQIISAVLAASIPMGVLQASSTQTDYVTAFWLICFINAVFSLRSEVKWPAVCLAGFSLGLTVLTKGTGYLYSAPFIIWLAVILIKREKRQSIIPFIIMIFSVLVLNIGYMSRNVALNDGRLTSLAEESFIVTNRTHTPSAILSNIIKNVGLHAGTPSESYNAALDKIVYKIHGILKIEPADIKTTFGAHNFKVTEWSYHEDYATNFFHLHLTAFFIFFYLFTRKSKVMSVYLGLILGSFFLFVIYMKWAPWHSRYHLPLFLLFTPFTGMMISQLNNKKLATGITVFFIFASMPWVWDNKSRPYFKKRNLFNAPRIELMFKNKRGYQFSYEKVIGETEKYGCSDIGLMMGLDSWEYPLWPMMKTIHKNFRIEHINVENASAKRPYPLGEFAPCGIIDDDSEKKSKIAFNGKTYFKTRQLRFAGYFTLDTDGESLKKSISFHFGNIIQNYTEVMNIVKSSGFRPELMLANKEAMMAIKEEIEESKNMIDRNDLDKLYAGLGNQFENNLVNGIELIIDGFVNLNQQDIRRGQANLADWSKWFLKHSQRVQKAFEVK